MLMFTLQSVDLTIFSQHHLEEASYRKGSLEGAVSFGPLLKSGLASVFISLKRSAFLHLELVGKTGKKKKVMM